MGVQTAQALLARGDLVGLRVFVRAYHRADNNGHGFTAGLDAVVHSVENRRGLVDQLWILSRAGSQAGPRIGAKEVLHSLGYR